MQNFSESKPFCAHSYTGRFHFAQADTVEVTLYVRMKSDYGTTDEIDVSGGTFYPEDGSIKRFGLEVPLLRNTDHIVVLLVFRVHWHA